MRMCMCCGVLVALVLALSRGLEAQRRVPESLTQLRSLAGGVFADRMVKRMVVLKAETKLTAAAEAGRWWNARGLEPLLLGELSVSRDGDEVFRSVRALPGSPRGCFSAPLRHDPKDVTGPCIVRWSAPPGSDAIGLLTALKAQGVIAVLAPSPALGKKAWGDSLGATPLPIPLLTCSLGDERRLRARKEICLHIGGVLPTLSCARILGRGVSPPFAAFAWLGEKECSSVAALSQDSRRSLLVLQESVRSLALTIAHGQILRPAGDLVFGVISGPLEKVRERLRRYSAAEGLAGTLLITAPDGSDPFAPRLSGFSSSPLHQRAGKALLGLTRERGFWKKVRIDGRIEGDPQALELGRPPVDTPSVPTRLRAEALTRQARAVLAILWGLQP